MKLWETSLLDCIDWQKCLVYIIIISSFIIEDVTRNFNSSFDVYYTQLIEDSVKCYV